MPGREAVEDLYTRYSRVVYRRARELLGDDAAARDAVQEVFVRVIKSGGKVPAEPSPTAWLYRVTTNLCLNRLRDRSRRGALLAQKYVQRDEVNPTSEVRAMVATILDRMPEEVQDIAVYFFVDELTYDEIARLVGISRRTVGNRLLEFRELIAQLFPDKRLLAS
jgi:RNA polymerase sigma-70 factor (ECF subfamily)